MFILTNFANFFTTTELDNLFPLRLLIISNEVFRNYPTRLTHRKVSSP